MKKEKRERLEEGGFTVGTASEFLDLTVADEMVIELRLALAKELREQRKQQGYTQAELAERCSTSQARISNLENGKAGASIDALVAALTELGADRKKIGRIIAGKPELFIRCLLRLISPKIPSFQSSTIRCIACGAQFWAFGADFVS